MPSAILQKALHNPRQAAMQLFFAASRAYWRKRYVKLARDHGFKRLYLIISFDCDTDRDAEAALRLHPHLVHNSIKPIYAVPGEILKDHAEIFSTIHKSGGLFINHGYTRHTYFDDAKKEYCSCFFYDNLSLQEVQKDIELGHKAVQEVLGIDPKGFRAPHFGTFCKKEHLQFLYSLLKQMGYTFSTSTTSLFALKNGPRFEPAGFGGLTEFPLSGRLLWPLALLDSWRYWDEVRQKMNLQAYEKEVLKLVRSFTEKGLPGLLNLYIDPSHVEKGSEKFVRILAESLRLGVIPTDYESLLEDPTCQIALQPRSRATGGAL